MPNPVIVLDFDRKQVTQIVPGNTQHEQTLADALDVQKRIKSRTAGVTAPPPPSTD